MKTVRDGKKVAPYCPECGCRLKLYGSYYAHFGTEWLVDARGCKCKYADMAWLPMNSLESITITAFNRGVAWRDFGLK